MELPVVVLVSVWGHPQEPEVCGTEPSASLEVALLFESLKKVL